MKIEDLVEGSLAQCEVCTKYIVLEGIWLYQDAYIEIARDLGYPEVPVYCEKCELAAYVIIEILEAAKWVIFEDSYLNQYEY